MNTVRTPSRILGLVGWLLACLATGAIGAVASVDAGAFYRTLLRPAWAPPAWLFAPVWTILYVLMAISAWLVWRAHGFRGAKVPLFLFVLQLAVNAAWTWIFFAWNQGGVAFAEILLLWILVLATVVSFWRLCISAAVLLLPYLAWITFAAMLTYSTWQLNLGVL